MATGSSQANTGSSQANTPLSKRDLGTLHNALYPARNSYRSLGLQIGVEIDEIESIEGKYNDHSDRLLAILSVRLKQVEPLTWNDIDRALRLDCVGESKTAKAIREKCPHLFSPDESTSDQEVQMHVAKEETKKRGKKRKADRLVRMSDRQEEDSDEEVSGRAKRKKVKYLEQRESDEDSSAISREEKLESQPPLHERLKKKIKKAVLMEPFKYKHPKLYVREGKRESKDKRKRNDEGKSLRYEFSETASDKHECQSNDDITIKNDDTPKKHKLPIQVKVKPGNESSSVQLSSQFHSETKRKKSLYAESKSKGKMHEGKEEEFLLKETQYLAVRKAAPTSDEREQYSPGREVSRKPTHQPKRKKEVESESDSATTSEEGTSEVTSLASGIQNVNESRPVTCIEQKIHQIKRKRLRKKQTLLQKSNRKVESQGRETEKHAKKREKEELAGKKAAALEYASDSTQEDSEYEESDMSEDEEDRDSEQVYSNEEEDTQPDYESSASTSEDEVQRQSGKSLKRAERHKATRGETRKGKEKRMKITTDAPDPPASLGPSDFYSKDQEKHGIQSKKRDRKSSMGPKERDSSSPSTSQEQRIQARNYWQEKEHQSSSSEIDDSSPESDKVKNLPEDEKKKLSGIFRHFYGELC